MSACYGKAESVETTQIYLHADLPPGRFRPDDELLAFLEGL
jgi:hypothetical protein